MTPDEVVGVLKVFREGWVPFTKGAKYPVEHQALTTAISLIQDYQNLLNREKRWQDMCNKHVGCSMLADEFSGEPHEPEEFGGYVDNLEQQAEDYQKLRERINADKIIGVMGINCESYPADEYKMANAIVTYLQQPTEH